MILENSMKIAYTYIVFLQTKNCWTLQEVDKIMFAEIPDAKVHLKLHIIVITNNLDGFWYLYCNSNVRPLCVCVCMVGEGRERKFPNRFPKKLLLRLSYHRKFIPNSNTYSGSLHKFGYSVERFDWHGLLLGCFMRSVAV